MEDQKFLVSNVDLFQRFNYAGIWVNMNNSFISIKKKI